MIRTAEVTVKLRLTMPEDYTGEIAADIEADVTYALQLDPDSTLGGADFAVLDVTAGRYVDTDDEGEDDTGRLVTFGPYGGSAAEPDDQSMESQYPQDRTDDEGIHRPSYGE
jgi:hypothetical protein